MWFETCSCLLTHEAMLTVLYTVCRALNALINCKVALCPASPKDRLGLLRRHVACRIGDPIRTGYTGYYILGKKSPVFTAALARTPL